LNITITSVYASPTSLSGPSTNSIIFTGNVAVVAIVEASTEFLLLPTLVLPAVCTTAALFPNAV